MTYSYYLCIGGKKHQFVRTGEAVVIYSSGDTSSPPPKDAPTSVKEVCSICGQDRWVYGDVRENQ